MRPADGPRDLGARLVELARRYSAVRLEGGARLHDAMGAFVREYLLTTEARHSDAVRQIAEGAAETRRGGRAAMEADLPTLAERVGSADWGQATLDLTHWLFWRDERIAWRELIPRLVEGLGYDLDLARGLLEVAEAFAPALGNDGRKRLKWLSLSDENRERLLDELERLAGRGWLDEVETDFAAERRAVLHLWRGRWLVERKRYDEALKAYLSAERDMPIDALDLRAQLSEAFHSLSGHFFFRAETVSAARYSESGLLAAQRAVVLDTENKEAWEHLGIALSEMGHNEAAMQSLRRAIQLDPECASSWHILGGIYRNLGCHQEAVDAYQKAIEVYQKEIEIEPKLADLWNSLGLVYDGLDCHQEAIEAYEKAIALDPKIAYAWNNIGVAYHYMGRHEQAIGAYRKAIELDPRYAVPWGGLGVLYRTLGRYQEAIEAYQRAVELDPDVAYPWGGLGSVCHNLGHYEEAIKAYQRAIELGPKYANSWNGLGNVYRTLGRHEEALAAYRQAR